MNLTIQRADLARILSLATKATESRNTIPILGNVLLIADGSNLQVIGTDLDIEYSASAPCSGEHGSTTVDARRLADIAKRLSGDTVSLELKDGNLVVKSGRSRFSLPTLPIEDFPRLDSGAMDADFKVDLAALVAPVKFAISTEETRYYLNGIYLHNPGSGLRAVATDGHKLCQNDTESVGNIPSVIIPRKTVGLIPTGIVDVGVSRNKVRFATADIIIVSKLIDGTFPDYGRVIPQNNTKIAKADRTGLAKAIDRVSTISSERGRAVKLSISPGSLVLSANNPESGSATEELEIEYEGEPLDIGFNSQYLGEVLGTITGETVTMKLADPGSPTLFTGDGNMLAVCMPMRVA